MGPSMGCGVFRSQLMVDQSSHQVTSGTVYLMMGDCVLCVLIIVLLLLFVSCSVPEFFF